MSETRKAGTGLITWLLTDPIGEELLEGTTGGLLAGAAQLGTDQPLGQTALQTATAIAGGIGVGMLGRRLGRRIGEAVHAAPLKNQEGQLAMLARTLGSESTAQGLKHQGQVMKGVVQEGLIKETSARMAEEALADPMAFAKRYGISADEFSQLLPQVQAGRVAAQAARMLETLSPEQRAQLAQQGLGQYRRVEEALTKEAAGSVDEAIKKAAEALQGESIPGMDRDAGEMIASLLHPVPKVTGAHVGQMAGRVLGDEIGVIGGLAVGNLLAQQLGMESPKDAKIRELEKQLASRGQG